MKKLPISLPAKRTAPWNKAPYFFVGVLIIYVASTLLYSNVNIRDMNTLIQFKHYVCTQNGMVEGFWQKKEHISRRNEFEREQKDIEIRRYRGLPLVLHRTDGRCGAKFLLNPSIQSLCNPHSVSPCCNHNTSMCGHGREYCSCKTCTDYSSKVSAELYDYVTPGCKLTNFTSQEACQLLRDRVHSLTFVGDSLIRHLNNAMIILLTNDPIEGALKKSLDVKTRKKCKGEYQFVDSGKTDCHACTSRNLDDIPRRTFCDGRFNFSYSFLDGDTIANIKETLDAVRKNLNKQNSIFVIGVGLHMNLAFDQGKKYMELIFKVKKKTQSKWPYIIWVPTHSQGSIKPVIYQQLHHNDKVLAFNQKMKNYLKPLGIPLLDTFNLTVGIKSYDGTHYGIGLNMVKAQLLLNLLKQIAV